MRSLVSMDRCPFCYVGSDQGNDCGFGASDVCQGAPTALTHEDHALTLAGLVGFKAAILAVFPLVGWLHIAAKVRAIHFDLTENSPMTTGPLMTSTMKVLFGMALRKTTGFVESLLRLTGLDWVVPDFSTICRRQRTLSANIPYRGAKGPLHLLIDSIGIRVEGEGEWNARKHGSPKTARLAQDPHRH